MNRFFSKSTSLKLIEVLLASSYRAVYDFEKHRLTLLDEAGNDTLYFRLPIVVPPLYTSASPVYDDVHYVILLIQSGSCAIGYFENGENLDHKVFRSYMVRKKQGKSQVKYLKTKGKSRAGSRVRLAETLEFFQNINERLQEYFEEYPIDRIAISCSKILIPYLYNSKVPTPFKKEDERLYRIPKHIHTPIYGVMMDVHKFLLKGELIYEEMYQDLVDELLRKSEVKVDEADAYEEDYLDDDIESLDIEDDDIF